MGLARGQRGRAKAQCGRDSPARPGAATAPTVWASAGGGCVRALGVWALIYPSSGRLQIAFDSSNARANSGDFQLPLVAKSTVS